jgi:hypothetical protein
VTALRVSPQPFELKVKKAKIVRAQGNVRSEAKHGMPGGLDQRYPDRTSIYPRNCAFKGLVSNPAWLESYEGSRKVVSPGSKGFRTSRLVDHSMTPLMRLPNDQFQYPDSAGALPSLNPYFIFRLPNALFFGGKSVQAWSGRN